MLFARLFGALGRSFWGICLTWPPKVLQGPPKGSKRVPQEVIFEGKGGIPKVAPPLYEEGPPEARAKSTLQSTRETWRHHEINDSYTF